MAKAMQPQKMRFSQAIQTPMYKNLVNNTLGDPARGARFIANITSAVAVNPALQECNPGTILAGALLGESLLLQPSPQLGQFYLVPFKSKAKRDRQGNVIEPASVKAQFVLGYKGYIQLALRTGQYKRLNVLEVKAGELSGWDPFEERFHEMHFIEDFEKRAAMPTVGYIAHFEYINGFEKTLYWTADQMMAHADKYSQAFSAAAYKKLLNGEIPQDELWKYSSFWYKDFDAMSKKTMLRQLISKWGIMTADMTTAREFITYLIQFCFHWGVPTKDSLLTQTDDIGKYLYLCLENRRCAICNQPAEVHHVDRVGMGRDREAIVHVGLNAIALCRRHHEEAHRREKALFADYHIYGIKLDRHLCKVLSLNQKPKGEVERGE